MLKIPTLNKIFKGKKVELDLSNYTIKSEIKNATRVETSELTKEEVI